MEFLSGPVFDALFAVAASIIPALGALLELRNRKNKIDKNIDKELGPLNKNQEKISNEIMKNPKRSVNLRVQYELNLIYKYYVINQNQAQYTFYSSLVTVFFGTATVGAGIWLFYIHGTANFLAALPTISGILLQFIGGVNFFLYRKSLDQLNYYFEQLSKKEDLMLAIELAENVQEQVNKINLTEKIVLGLLNGSSNNSNNETLRTTDHENVNPHTRLNGANQTHENLNEQIQPTNHKK